MIGGDRGRRGRGRAHGAMVVATTRCSPNVESFVISGDVDQRDRLIVAGAVTLRAQADQVAVAVEHRRALLGVERRERREGDRDRRLGQHGDDVVGVGRCGGDLVTARAGRDRDDDDARRGGVDDGRDDRSVRELHVELGRRAGSSTPGAVINARWPSPIGVASACATASHGDRRDRACRGLARTSTARRRLATARRRADRDWRILRRWRHHDHQSTERDEPDRTGRDREPTGRSLHFGVLDRVPLRRREL